ncbi:hypothetical protein ACIRSS_23655 [Amycolatopsis sp. NPDC101161]|uniref:hypothetical protein n=1 Tax=Amycolatopsis sp. NPDC101161 TaxID=3363940 RepID=UPI003801C48D
MTEFIVVYAVAVAATMAVLAVATLVGRATRANVTRSTFLPCRRRALSAVTESAVEVERRVVNSTRSVHRHRATAVGARR